ncbi:prevent-host-death protein [Geminocystis sp.]|uniref:prevent-host-death protein n=1 Tax=Geminocystis sp. TaxID=2664100 RepID=UPI0035943AA9
MNITDVQYVSDAQGNNIAVIVPIELWQKLTTRDDTDYLLILSSKAMKERLLTAKNRQTGISLQEACERHCT